MLDQTQPFQIECDASKYASGAVLMQLDVNGDQHPCAFISWTFSPTEQNYEIYDCELLSMIRALQELQHYIQGSPHETTIYLDHKNLTYFQSTQKLNRWQAQWSLLLSKYDIKLVHLPGPKIILSNMLSWWPDFVPEKDTNNEDIVLLLDWLFINLIDIELQREIANTNNLDMDATAVIMLLLGKGPTNFKQDLSDWTTEDFEGKSILFYQGKNYIPKDYDVWKKIISWYHNLLSTGHLGEIETLNAVKEHYWWPGMWTFINNYVKGCSICQQFKINQSPSAPSFNPIPGPITTRPFTDLSMDLITDLPLITLDNGTIMDAILSIVDHRLTKGVILTPCLKTLTEGASEILLHQVYKRFSLPNSITSDQDSWFTAKSFQELLKLLGIKSKLTTAYRPQSDRTMECFNQEIEAYIGIYCSLNPKTWHKSISTMEFTHNSQWHSDRQWTSFELMMGTSPLAIPTTFEYTKFPSVEEWIQQLTKDQEEAIATHESAWKWMAEWHKNKFSGFKLDQLVWLNTWNLKTKYHKKMAPKCEGPFWISKVLGPVTYQLELPPT